MPGVSIHVVDVSRGVVASGMKVEMLTAADAGPERVVAAGQISAGGTLDHPALAERFAPGFYVARFHLADYYRAAGGAAPAVPFLDIISYRFGIADPAQHYHLPMKCTPWGYSCFRGGA
jgi:5-hydroxyisourate hydrolase